MVRVTFSLDDATVERLRRTAARLRKPQSQVVREAIAEFAAGADRTSRDEQHRLLTALERLRGARRARSARAVDAELREVRRARRAAGDRRSGR